MNPQNVTSRQPSSKAIQEANANPGPDTITVGIRVGSSGDGDRVEVESSEPGVLIRVEPALAR